MERLVIEQKTTNQGVNSAGKLGAGEFNKTVEKINELVDFANKKAYVTQDQYDDLARKGELLDDVEYNIYDE